MSATAFSCGLLHGVSNCAMVWCYHARVTEDLVHKMILHCVTAQTVSVFRKVIVPCKHCELCTQ